MSIRFQCPGCAAWLDVADSLAGNKVRCGGCQAVADVPASQEPPLAVLLTAQEPPPPPPPPPVPRRTDRPRRPRREEPEEPSIPWAMVLGLGGGVLLLLGGVAVSAVFLLVDFSPARPRPAPVAFGPGPGRGWKDDGVPNFPPPPGRPDAGGPPLGPGKEPPALSTAKPRPVTFKDGRFEDRVTFTGPEFEAAAMQRAHPFTLEAKADGAYVVEAKDHQYVRLRIEGPDGPVEQPGERFGPSQPQRTFITPKAGRYTITLTVHHNDARPCSLTVREVGDAEVLPLNRRLPSGPADLPELAVSQTLRFDFNRRMVSAAFAPDGKTFYLSHSDGSVTVWSHPANEQKGSYAGKQNLHLLGVDARGRVYAQAGSKERFPRPGVSRPAGGLMVWDRLAPAGEGVPLPDPTRTVALRGVVQRMIPSKDGRWLFFLDSHNRKLGRIDSARGEVEKELELGPGVNAFCLTPDGKTLYACSTFNRIDVVDPEKLAVQRSVRLDQGQPTDIAATDDGRVYLAGGVTDTYGIQSYGLVVNLKAAAGDPAKAAPLGVRCHCQRALMLPDQRAVLLSGDRRINVCAVTRRPTVFRTEHRESNYERITADMYLSPDGRTLITDAGTILSVSR